MKRILLAASAALAMTAIPVSAKDRDRTWNGDATQMQASLQTGIQACVGNKKQGDCMVWNPITRILGVSTVYRPHGLNKNLHVLQFFLTDDRGEPLRDESGAPRMIASHVAEQQNAAAIWNTGLSQLPAAFANGMGAAAIVSAFGPNCNGNNCGGGPQVVNILQNEANAAAAASTAVSNVIGQAPACPSGACPNR